VSEEANREHAAALFSAISSERIEAWLASSDDNPGIKSIGRYGPVKCSRGRKQVMGVQL
jgi:hypothetical protein